MTVKLIGIIMLIMVSSLAGNAAASALYRRIKNAETLIYLADDFENMIRYQSLTVTEMIEASSENPEYRNLDFIQKLAVLLDTEHDVHEIWQKCVSDSSVLGSDEKELMFSFGNMLGKSDTGGQISSIKIYKKRLEFLLEKFRNEYERKGRMYRSAGLLLGIMTGIVLL